MDSIDQVLATGGASGITITVLFLIYKFCQNRHIRSKCCGKEIDIDTAVSTPKIVIDNRDEEASSHSSTKDGYRTGRSRDPVCENKSRVLGEGSTHQEGECCSDTIPTTENPLTKSISKSVQPSDDT